MNAVGTLEIEKQKRIEKKAKNASFARRQTERYGEKCQGLPRDLKEWQAYKELKLSIENLKQLLPIITILKKDAVKPRHWDALNDKT